MQDFLHALCDYQGWFLTGEDVQMHIDEELSEMYPVTVCRMQGKAFIGLADFLEEAIEDLRLTPTMPIDEIIAQIYDADYTITPDEALYYTLEEKNFVPAAQVKASMRMLSGSDKVVFDLFIASCTEQERMYGGVSLDDPIAMGVFVGDTLHSVASCNAWGEHLYDISVLTRPSMREKGYGKLAVSALCKEILKRGTMPMYRCEEGNPASKKLCERLGFTLALRLEGAIVDFDEQDD